MKRKCKSCFRYIEDWRDAKAKGLKAREQNSLADISYKPRKGVSAKCLSIHKDEPVSANDKGCKYHKYRWSWNLEMWWKWSVSYKFGRWICEHIICPIGGLRKPVPLEWIDSFNGMTDEIIKNGEPKCPRCGEMPYSTYQCVFCGQRFIHDEKIEEFEKPSKIEHKDCVICGDKDSVSGTRAKINGHFHGKCEKCGAVYME